MYSQNSINDFLYGLKTLDKARLSIILSEKKIKDPSLQKILKIQLELLEKGETDTSLPKHDIIEKASSDIRALFLMSEADLLRHQLIGQDSIIFNKYKKALVLSSSKKNKTITCEILKRILVLISQNEHLIYLYPSFLKTYNDNIYDKFERINYIFLKLNYQFHNSTKSLVYNYKQNLNSIPRKKSYDILRARHYRMIGMNFDIIEKKYDSAYFNHQKSVEIYNKYDFFLTNDESFSSKTNLGIVLNQEKKYEISSKILKEALKTKLRKDKLYNKVLTFKWISNNFEGLQKYDSALFYLKKRNTLNDSLSYLTNSENISYTQTKFETAEKEKQILLEQQKKKRNQNIAIGLGGSLFLGSIITVLIYRNTKRKQHIAEQEREIEIQKTEKLLKEQELSAIDAMISGQEKERQRLANDLHDNLGSTLATVKLHFDHLKNNRDNPKVENIEELYSKTNSLLDEAYQKVRTIAHEKNSGVMAKQGLLPAIKNLAKKASNGNELKIEIQDYGLDERLDNTLEISIFRIIQELITNTIKHANASEIHISLTNHDSLLNIIVEDNGKGFNAKILPEKDGMGLKSIEKRIEHMEGTFEIDSTIDKGTNIIINIPI
ncbi:sensor histidine kinase [uncultured Aquimarina sp.]|uniref:sensor histidine kinase n=1 Tax=uncultured Aquimarina sp. TaxID=575652 RepID=UPI00262B8E5A|nr:sensor histidine kinase [uncultured Aquimarina sp.]